MSDVTVVDVILDGLGPTVIEVVERGPQGLPGADGPVPAIPGGTILGNITGTTAAPTAITPEQARELLDVPSNDDLTIALDALSIDGGTPYTTFGAGAMVSVYDNDARLMAYGTPAVAKNFLANGKSMLILSDSTLTKGAIGVQQPFYRSSRLRKVRNHQSFPFSPGGYFAAGANNYPSTTEKHSPYFGAYEYPLSATLVPANGGNWYANRIANYNFQAAVTPSNTTIETDNCSLSTGDLLTITKTAGGRITLEVMAYTGGEPQDVFTVIAHSGTTEFASANFNSYNAGGYTVRKIVLDFNSWSGEVLGCTVKLREGMTPTAGKHLVLLSATLEALPTVSSNMIIDAVSYGGEQVATYLDATKMSSTAWTLLEQLNYDCVMIALGINGYATPDLATWKANYQSLIGLIRQNSPNRPIILSTELPLSTPVPAFATTLQEIVDANANTLLLCTDKMLPIQATAYQGYTSAYINNTWYRRGDIVTHSGRTYCCLGAGTGSTTTTIRSTTAPNVNTTQWADIGANVDNDTMTVDKSRNILKADSIHPSNPFGQRLYGMAWWSLLENVARVA